jgi:hypothetical protein
MANTYPKTTVAAGEPGTAVFANHIQEQADYIETDLAAGTLPILATALTGTIAAARLPARNASVFLSAAGGKPRTTGGCAPAAWTELSTNKVMVPSLDFGYVGVEYAQWMFAWPDGYAGGTVTPVVYWTAASGSGAVVWGVAGRSLANDEAMDQAVATGPTDAADSLITAYDVHVVAMAPLTLNGTPAGGELCIIQIYRDPTHASDTLGADAKLLGIKLEFSTSYGD